MMERKRMTEMRISAPTSVDKRPRMSLFSHPRNETQVSNLRQRYNVPNPGYSSAPDLRAGVSQRGSSFQQAQYKPHPYSSTGTFTNQGREVQNSATVTSFPASFPQQKIPYGFQMRTFAEMNYQNQGRYLQSSFGSPLQSSPSMMPSLPTYNPYSRPSSSFSNACPVGQLHSGFGDPETFLMDEGVDPGTNAVKSSADRTLRILSTSVEGMKRWAKYRNEISVLFEVFGVVNSAVSGDGSTEAVQFVLKDANGATINCIFHQIDRALPRLIRGQWYRCIGRYSFLDTACLRCVSIRPASESEKSSAKILMRLSDDALQTWIQRVHEM